MKTSPYQTAQGDSTTKDDPKRLLWYSSNCTYWTDDWTKLKTFRDMPDRPGSGIPCCPHCGSPGMQAEAGLWLASAAAHDADGRPHYMVMLQWQKERCVKVQEPRRAIYEAFAAGFESAGVAGGAAPCSASPPPPPPPPAPENVVINDANQRVSRKRK